MECFSHATRTQARGQTNARDGDEIPIPRHALKNVQLSVQAAAVERIKDLREHKRIENKGLHNAIVMLL